MKILVSACLLGENCKYNGKNNFSEKLNNFIKEKNVEVVSVCPEVLGGLTIPREPCEIVNEIVQTQNGVSKDKEYRQGALKALNTALLEKVDFAVLQSRSPSCGVNKIYDGSFSKKLIDGNGVFAELLKKNEIHCVDVEDL